MKEEIYIDTISGEKLIKEIWYYNNGNIQREYYFINNEYHREDGPAIICYYGNGNIEVEYYFINGKEITDELQIMVMKGLSNI